MSHRPSYTIKRNYVREYNYLTGNPRYTADTRQRLLTSVPVSTTGYENKDYKVQIANMQNASTAYSTIYYEILREGIARTTNKKYDSFAKCDFDYYGYRECHPFTGHLPVPTDDALRDAALGKLKKALSKDVARFEGLVNIGELTELRSTIKAIAQSLTNILRTLVDIKYAIRHMSPAHARNAVARASDLWLAWSFGIKPMLGQAEALGQALGAYYSDPRSERYYGKAEKKWMTHQKNLGSLAIGAHTACQHNLRVEHSLSYKYDAGVKILIDSANDYASIDKQFGLQFGDIVPAMWELTPYSWVFDYFVNFGEFLSDYFTAPAGNTIYCTLATHYRAIKHYDFGPVIVGNDPTIHDVEFTFEHCVVIDGSFTRTIQPELPHRTLHFKSVDQIADNWFNKALNLAAILGKR